jgi:hypothetical protein
MDEAQKTSNPEVQCALKGKEGGVTWRSCESPAVNNASRLQTGQQGNQKCTERRVVGSSRESIRFAYGAAEGLISKLKWIVAHEFD